MCHDEHRSTLVGSLNQPLRRKLGALHELMFDSEREPSAPLGVADGVPRRHGKQRNPMGRLEDEFAQQRLDFRGAIGEQAARGFDRAAHVTGDEHGGLSRQFAKLSGRAIGLEDACRVVAPLEVPHAGSGHPRTVVPIRRPPVPNEHDRRGHGRRFRSTSAAYTAASATSTIPPIQEARVR